MTKQKKLHFFIVEDSKTSAAISTALLEKAGHKVTTFSSSTAAYEQIIDLQPDCVLCDLMMPDLDGVELLKSIRQIQNIKQPSYIIISSKIFDFDRHASFLAGVDGYLTKPINPETFVTDLMQIINHNMVIKFWGVRGTLPVPGKKTVRYGGNTNCVTLCFAQKEFLIFDGGTGLKELSNYLVERDHFPMSAKMLITHPHYDHINGIPFFLPFYMPGNEFEIIGTNQHELSIESLFAGQMDTIYFPITTKEFSAKLTFRNIKEESFHIGDLYIQTILLNHPGRCLGYKVQYEKKSFCFITDNELYLEDSPQYDQSVVDKFQNFIHGTDLLVIDSTYSDEEYIKKIGWGHSCISRIVDVADRAKVKTMALFHHDPDQFDNDIDLKLKQTKELLAARGSKTQCIAPSEGDEIII